MKRVIRTKTWETNSSSVHSLIIDESGLEPCNIPRNEENELIVDFGKFGKDGEIYTSQSDKLSYLLTCMAHSNGGWYHGVRAVKDSWVYHMIEEHICKYADADGIYIPDEVEPEIDHQSMPQYSDDFNGVCNPYSYTSVINFVFNKYISLFCTCD